jgi:hypothetical protein
VRQENREAAAAAIVEGELAVSNLAELHGRLEPCFGRVEPFRQARKYIAALVSDLPRKNGWTIAEYAGDSTPQWLLNHAVWDNDRATAVVRGFVAGHLADELVVGALGESGQQKQGAATAGVQRQYMGCAGRVENGVDTVYCSYATLRAHALVGALVNMNVDVSHVRLGRRCCTRRWRKSLDLRSRLAGGGFKPPTGALAEDRGLERCRKRRGKDRVRCGPGR